MFILKKNYSKISLLIFNINLYIQNQFFFTYFWLIFSRSIMCHILCLINDLIQFFFLSKFDSLENRHVIEETEFPVIIRTPAILKRQEYIVQYAQ